MDGIRLFISSQTHVELNSKKSKIITENKAVISKNNIA